MRLALVLFDACVCVKYVTTNLEAAAPSSPAADGRHFNGGHFNFDPRETETQPGTD